MAWNPAIPVTGADLLSAPVRENFAALDTQVVGPLVTLAPNLVLMVGASDNLAAVPAGTNGFILTLVGGVPLWQPAPTGVAYPLLAPDGSAVAPSYSFAGDATMGLSRSATILTVNGSEYVALAVGGVNKWVVSAGLLLPGADGTMDLGASSYRLQDFYLYRGMRFTEQATAPVANVSGQIVVYAKTDKLLYQKDDAGLETPLAGGGGGGAKYLRLLIESATLPDGTTGNMPPELIRSISTGTLTNAPKVSRTVAAFDGAVDEHLTWAFTLPGDYVSGGTLRLKWRTLTTDTTTVIWKAGAAVLIDGTTNASTVAYAAVNLSAATAQPGVAFVTVETTITLTMTNAAAHRTLHIFVGRDADTDTSTGDIYLTGVTFEYTA